MGASSFGGGVARRRVRALFSPVSRQPSKVNFLLPWLQLSGPPRSDICAGVPSADTAGKAAVILLRLGSGVGSGTARFAGCRVAPAPQAFFQLRSRGRVFTGLVHLAPPTLLSRGLQIPCSVTRHPPPESSERKK